MAALDKETVKKHHFWFLFIPYAIFALVLFVGLVLVVSGRTEDRRAEIDKHDKEIKAVNAESKELTPQLEKQREGLAGRRTEIWKGAWDEQKPLYSFPKGYGEQAAALSDQKFGTPFAQDIVRQTFRDERKYPQEFQDLADKVAPMQFAGGWQAVLRHIPPDAKTQPPTAEEIWLALEDLWVQRELVMTAFRVNESLAKFAVVTEEGVVNEPKHRTFRSRIWDLELTVENLGQDQVIRAKLKNRTNRLQALGLANVMYVKLWLDPDPNFQTDDRAIIFPIEGEVVKAGETIDVKFLKAYHTIRERFVELHRAEQVFDGRTLPVKRVDRIALGYQSSRTFALALKSSKFSKKAIEDAATAAAESGAAAGGGLPGMGMPMGGGSEMMPGGGGAMPGGPGGAGAASPNDLTPYYSQPRKRYIEVTTQVRRMPVGMVLLIDQAYIQDFLVSMSNSKLRFQNTQYHWKRFRGQFTYSSGVNFGGTNFDPSAEGRGAEGGGAAFAPGGGPKGGLPPPRGSGAFAPPGGAFPPGGRPMMPGKGPMMPGKGPMMPMMPGSPGMYNPGFSGSLEANQQEDQSASSLVELSVYSIASIYEKYQTEEEIAAAAATPEASPN